MHAEMHKYDTGKFALIWVCCLCHIQAEFGTTTARTLEPSNAQEALT